jgi:hypothetical protein
MTIKAQKEKISRLTEGSFCLRSRSVHLIVFLSNTFQERNLIPIISTHETALGSRVHLLLWMSLRERWLHFNQ